MSQTGKPALRRDAAANRDRLLTAAAELFAEHGLAVTLNDIAHHAGVGVGTAYRRFANKEQIIDALLEQRMQEVANVAREALDDPDAWNGLLTFLQRALHLRHGDQGLNEVMNNPLLGDARGAEVRDRIAPIITELVDKAKRQGAVRPDLDQIDIIFMQLALSAIIDKTREISPDLYLRYLTFFLDGIRTRADATTPSPVGPLSANQTHLAMTQQRHSADRHAALDQ